MLNFLHRLSRRFVRKSTQVFQTPLNKVSLVILIIIDVFVLINVFSGLYSVSSFPLSPQETYPCYADYQTFHDSQSNLNDRQFSALQGAFSPPAPVPSDERRLGQVDSLCQNYLNQKQAVDTPENRQLIDSISGLENNIIIQENKINELQQQYDSTLLEKIAGQDPQDSITTSSAGETRRDIEQAQGEIDRWRQEIDQTKLQLTQTPTAQAYLETLSNPTHYQTLKRSYAKARFWYPNLQFLLQVLFLVPLIGLTYAWHHHSIQSNKGLQSLLSWHLLLIFCIPLIVRAFEFLQFSNLAAVLVRTIITLVGGLWFIASYLFIFTIPLLGFGLIKLLQYFVFNPKIQAKKRIQKQRCMQCNARLYTLDPFCPHCGFNQYQECPHCHQSTYQYAPFCRVCGTAVSTDHSPPQLLSLGNAPEDVD
ncbi:MAG: zinc ribbon domain-containing protein [Prochlorotrichaceae cyanobacterium]